MMTRLLVAAVPSLLVLSGCGLGHSKAPPAALGLAPAPLIPASSTPASAGRCDAASLAYLVGRPRTAIPAPVDPSRRRVTCSTCPIADDFRPDRTNVLFDAQTGLILSITCG